MMMRTLVLLLTTTVAGSAAAAQPLTGLWDATVKANGVDVPFRFEITAAGASGAAAAFFNGDERVRSTSGRFDKNALWLEFGSYAGKLQARFENGELTGTYQKGSIAPWAFHAKRYAPVAAAGPGGKVPDISGLWDIQAKSSKGESAWRLIVRQSGGEVSAAVLRVDGDSGMLTGAYRDGKFILSHFSGARPSLFEITVLADGTLEVVQNGKAKYSAVRSAVARAKGLEEPADPSRWTSVRNPAEPLHFAAPDLNGVVVSETDARFQGKVVLVNITGSWCPNCHDEAPFLAELYRKYKGQGLEIVALSFEEEDQLKELTRLKAFIRNYGLEYTVLVAGDPADAGKVLPQAVNLNTFPATFFVGRDGLVRGSHAGFAGKATGEAHEQLKAEISGTVERLLAEKVVSAR